MAIINWKSAVSGAWSTTKDWSGAVPGASDTAVFATGSHKAYTVTGAPTAGTVDVVGDQVTFSGVPYVQNAPNEVLLASGGANVTFTADDYLTPLQMSISGKGTTVTVLPGSTVSASIGTGSTLTMAQNGYGIETLAGGTFNGTLIAGSITGYGTVVGGPVAHAAMEASGGTLTVTGTTNYALIDPGATLALTSGTGPIDFNGVGGALQIAKSIGSTGFLGGFQAGDTVDLKGVVISKMVLTPQAYTVVAPEFSVPGGELLQLFAGAKMVDAFTIAGPASALVGLTATSDHSGGSILSWLPTHTTGVAISSGN